MGSLSHLGGPESGSGNHIDYWYVDLNGGEQLQLEFANNTSRSNYNFDRDAPAGDEGQIPPGS